MSFRVGKIKCVARPNVMEIRHENKLLKEKAIRVMEATKLDSTHPPRIIEIEKKISETPN